MVNLSLTKDKKNCMDALLFWNKILKLKDQYKYHYAIYTNGSINGSKVAAAAVSADGPQ